MAESPHDDEVDENMETTTTKTDAQHDESFQEHYSRAFQVIYGPVPAVASAGADAPTTTTPPVPIVATNTGVPTDEYLETLQESLVPIVPPAVKVSTAEERKKPRLIRVQNATTKKMERVQETPEQAQQRYFRQERKHERISVTRRWKQRMVDLRAEEDVGGAMYERAKRHLAEKVRRELREQQEQEQERQKQQEEEQEETRKQQQQQRSQNSNDGDEDSVQEQQDVLDRLTQQSMDDGTGDDTRSRSSADDSSKSAATSTNFTSADETFDNWTEGDASVSYRERLDYFEYGYTNPTKKELEFYHNAPDLRPRLHGGQALKDPDEDEGGLRLPIGRSMLTKSSDERHQNWEPSYFPSTKLSRSPRFFQYRLLQAMAARHLCGTALGEDEKLENRLLRLLFSTAQHEGEPLAKFTPARTLLRLSHQLGCNALVFAKHTWSDPMEVARQLGLLQENGMVEHHFLAGRLQNPGGLAESMKKRRRRVLRKYKMKPRPWIFESFREANVGDPTDELSSVSQVVESAPVTAAEAEETDHTTEHEGTASVGQVAPCAVQEETTTGGGNAVDDIITKTDVNSPKAKENIENGKTQGPPPTQEPFDETSSSQEDKVTGGTSAGGVVIDLQTVQSEPTKESRSFNENPAWQIAVHEAMLFPTSTFSHIPGTSPQVPQFPLDLTGIVYGPIDRFAKYDHQNHRIHHGHFQLALATLLSRVVRGNTDQQRRMRERIQKMLEQYVNINDSKGYKRQLVQSRGKVRDVPLVQFYLALRSYCSFWANGYPILIQEGHAQMKEEEETLIKEEEDDDLYVESETDSIDTRQVAAHLFDFLEHRIQHNGLVRFPQVRVTYVLAAICRKLPIDAANILSRARDDEECPTPLHIMRQTCEYLESHSLIRGGQDMDYADLEEDSMLAGELEYIFYEAAEMLEACIKAAPTDIEYHSWRIGALAVCLLLGSGNKIGSKARRFPSKLTRKAYERVGRDDDILEHEVRERLPKYEEVASQLSSSIRVLFALARHQPGARSHLTLASLLEWTQVIALLAGDALGSSTEKITSLYRHHSLQRFLQENSGSARRALAASSKTSSFFASELENDPGNIENWRALSKSLGPIGVEIPSAGEDDTAHRSTCKNCQLLRTPRLVDHKCREDSGETWWGHGRKWWSSSLLQIKHEDFKKRNQSKTEAVIQKLEERVEDIPECQSSSPKNLVDPDNTTTFLSWLPSRQVLRQRSKMKPSNEDRAAAYDEELPPNNDEESNADPNGNIREFLTLKGNIPPQLEVLCYKILIFCHLEGPGHPFVESRIYPLIRASWDNKNECIKEESEEFQVLLWLYNIGLDIPTMSRLRYPKILRQPLKKSYVQKAR